MNNLQVLLKNVVKNVEWDVQQLCELGGASLVKYIYMFKKRTRCEILAIFYEKVEKNIFYKWNWRKELCTHFFVFCLLFEVVAWWS